MSYKNRGMLLETIINRTIKFYSQHKLALFHKKELPIRFSKVIKNEKLVLKDAYILSKSTIDYYGVYQGNFIAFEAKSCQGKYFRMQNVALHQKQYLNLVHYHKGIAFYLLFMKDYQMFFYIEHHLLNNSSQKQFSIDFLKHNGQIIPLEYPGIIDFLVFLRV